ncbi:hypothetical protein E2562_029184 [Oryza meyeriana var. granulata]|uniref:Uncharacterized protein n=1 Tax=Oryza meyeriana var. granulata TaxID=110450 RepID=A0A6G1BZA7_9ORYZ|nr:hypothetical protein E2562_029184 [Oryza meyeriana var. granulata]
MLLRAKSGGPQDVTSLHGKGQWQGRATNVHDYFKASNTGSCELVDLLPGQALPWSGGAMSLPERQRACGHLPLLGACPGVGGLRGIYNDFEDLGLEALCARGLRLSPLE